MKKLYGFLCLGLLLVVSSCGTSTAKPEYYEEEIEDAVKFYIADAEHIMNSAVGLQDMPEDELLELVELGLEEILALYVSTDMNFQGVLEHLSKDQESEMQEDAASILSHYNRCKISLSRYVPVESSGNFKSWKVLERYSGIEFVFEMDHLDRDTITYSCTPYEEPFLEYLYQRTKD